MSDGALLVNNLELLNSCDFEIANELGATKW